MSDQHKAVFLSYASQDAEAARRICEALRAAGVEVWFDQSELRGGDAWDQSIRRQIKACALFVPVISASTQARAEGYFRLEWKLADDRTHLMARGTRFILPVCVDDTKDWDAIVPDSFTTVQWTRLAAGEGAAAFAERVKKLLSGEPPPSPKATASQGGAEPVGRDRRIPPSTPDQREDRGGIGDPALHKKRRPVWPWLVAAIVALPVLYFIFKPRRSPEELAKIIAQAQTIAANATKEATATPPLTEARQLVVKAWEQMNKPELARAEVETADGFCRRATELEPNNAEAWAAWSQVDSWAVYHNLDRSPVRRESARTKAARTMQLAPDSYEARLAQACQLVRAGGGQTASLFDTEAEGLLRALLRDHQDEPRALLALGILLRNAGKFAEAREVFGRLVKNPAFAAQGWNELGWAEWFASDNRAAEAAIDTSIGLLPYWGNLGLKTLIAQTWWGDLDLAKATLDRISSSSRQEDNGISFSTDLYYWRREPEAMLQELGSVPRDWLQSNGFDGPKAYWAALAHRMAGHGEAARIQWQTALKLVERRLADSPDSGPLIHWRGVLLAELGNRAEAETDLRLAREMRSTRSNNPDDAVDQVLLGNLDAAIGLLEREVDESVRGITAAKYRLDPAYDPLRKEPRFEALLARMEADPRFSPKAKLAATTQEPGPQIPDPSRLPPVDAKSVAVLAFTNLSDDKGNEYFSDGISEELLNVLAKIPGLKVTARTSSFHFKGKDTPIPEIARELGVAYVIEGSVRKQGDKVRITAQLIKATDGFHVWSDTFTRDLKDIFAVQDEIAGLIAKNLELKLGDGNRPTRVVNPEAHQLYLQGKYFLNQYSLENARRAAGLLQRAVELDPEFALAWAALSRAGSVRGGYADSLQEVEEGFALARRAADQALALDPNLAAAYVALVEVQIDHEYNWKGAAESLRRAQALAPTDAAVIDTATRLAYAVGQTERAVGLGGQAVALDPVNPAVRIYYGFALDSLRRFPEAEAQFRRVIELNSTAPWGHAGVSFTYISQGRFDEAATEAELESNEWSRLTTLAMARWGQKKRPEADDTLARLIKANAEVAAYQISEVQAFRHDNDRAFEWLERAYRQRDAGLAWCKSDSSLENLHADPRWDTFLRKLGLADDQLK